MTEVKVAVIWSRFGPYHVARLRGAALAMPGARILGIEVASSDRDYAWSIEPGSDGFERTTVFPNQNYHDLSGAQIASEVSAALDRLRPDVVAINGWAVPEARSALSWVRRHRARAILMTETKANDLKRVWWKEAIKSAIVKRFDAALVGGRSQAEYLQALGFAGERVRMGYDAIDNAYFEAGSDAARTNGAEVRKRLSLPENYFFACTRFLERKNLAALLRAYAQYRSKVDQPWHLVIAGSGEEEDRLYELAHILGIAHVVTWAGFAQYPDLPSYFGLARAFIHPAKSEAWGLVVNEAAASGLPLLVARPVGSALELVREGETGHLFDPEDDDDIARVLIAMTDKTPECRERMGRKARSLVADWGPARFGAELSALAISGSIAQGRPIRSPSGVRAPHA